MYTIQLCESYLSVACFIYRNNLVGTSTLGTTCRLGLNLAMSKNGIDVELLGFYGGPKSIAQ